MPAKRKRAAKKATKKTAKQKEEAKAYDDVFEEPAKEPVPVAPEAPLIDLEDFDQHAPGQLAPSEDAESLSDAPKLIPPVVATKEPKEPKTPSPEVTKASPAVKLTPPKEEGTVSIKKAELRRIAQLIQGLASDAKFLSSKLQLSPQNYSLMCARREASEQVLTQITILLK